MVRWAGHLARIGEKRNVYKFLMGNPEGKRPLGRPRLRSVNNMILRWTFERGGCICRIHLAQDKNQWRALVNTVMNLQVP
jgi:hypothetical protein